jgi:uncharacterized protein (DUF433 family)
MLEIQSQPVPLTLDDQGQARIGGTRVTLDTVVAAFLDGDSAEAISEQYPPLSLADVYAVIAFYLNNQRQVDQYLQERKQKSLEIRQRVEARFNPAGIRQRLLARMQKGE